MERVQLKIFWSDEKIVSPERECVIILIDVLRASSFIAVAMNKNAQRVIVTKEKEEALQIKKDNDTFILAGERGGKKLEGFDINNSPCAIENIAQDKTFILNSGNFCSVVEGYANKCIPVIAGSLLNAKEIAMFICKKEYKVVYLIPIGTYHFKGKQYQKPLHTEEDLIGALFIAHEISKKKKIDIEIPEKYLPYFSHEKKFEELFLELKYPKYLFSIDDKQQTNKKDIGLCIQLNKYPCVPFLDDEKKPYFFKRNFQNS